MDSLKEKLLRGGLWVTAGKGLFGLLTLAVNALLTRILAPGEVGFYFLLLSLASILALVAQSGMNQVIVRMLAESRGMDKPRSAHALISTVYLLVAISTGLVIVLFLGGLGNWVGDRVLHTPLRDGLLLLVAAWIVLLAFRGLLAETFRGLHDLRLATLFEGLLGTLLFILLLCVLYLISGDGALDQVVMLAVIATGISVLTAIILLKSKLGKTGNGTAMVQTRQILLTAWPLWVTAITLFILGQSDIWVMGIFREQHEVGVYGAVSRLVALVSIPLMIINAVVPPMIAELNTRGHLDVLEKTLRATATFAALPALVAIMIIVFWSGDILDIIYGEYYVGGASVLLVLSIGQLVNVWCGSCGFVLMMTGHQVEMMKISVLCGTISIVIALTLVSELGGLGVATGVTVGLVMQNILMLLAVKRYLGIWTHLSLRMAWQRLPGSGA